MKTIKIIVAALLGIFIYSYSYAAIPSENSKDEQNDTTTYTVLSGKIIDQETEKPVVFASVYKAGTSIGTVSNIDGEFILKIPGNEPSGNISISFLGYKNKEVPAENLLGTSNVIKLETHAIPIDEVVIRGLDPIDLLTAARLKVKENYSMVPEMQTGFYRETIKTNKSYVSISEAVLNIYNAGYTSFFDSDRVKIFKGRKSNDVKKMDTILVKFQGGPRTSLYLDLVKNPDVILDPEIFPYYNYSLNGIVSIDDRDNYEIEFSQKELIDYPLYQGKIFLDKESLAVTGVNFEISEMSIDEAAKVLIKRKPLSMKMDVMSGNYMVKYRLDEEKWHLNYVRSEVVFRCKWAKKLFRKKITTMFEMAITKRDPNNVDKFSSKEAVRFKDILSEQVVAFDDPDFWGEYNYIKPDESIDKAIEKISNKLK